LQPNTHHDAERLADIVTHLFSLCQEKGARHVTEYGVSIVEARCMRILNSHKNLTVNQLAGKMSLTSSRVTRIIDSLVEKALVVRESSDQDRRIYYLSLTSEGEQLAESLASDHIKIHEEILALIPSGSQNQLIEMLQMLNQAMEKWLQSEK